MIQRNVSFLCRGSVSREGGMCEQSIAAVLEPPSHLEGLAERRPKGLSLLGTVPQGGVQLLHRDPHGILPIEVRWMCEENFSV